MKKKTRRRNYHNTNKNKKYINKRRKTKYKKTRHRHRGKTRKSRRSRKMRGGADPPTTAAAAQQAVAAANAADIAWLNELQQGVPQMPQIATPSRDADGDIVMDDGDTLNYDYPRDPDGDIVMDVGDTLNNDGMQQPPLRRAVQIGRQPTLQQGPFLLMPPLSPNTPNPFLPPPQGV